MISSLQLASLCGVSQGTVDRALHGRPGIAAATREKVLEAARRHGYVPNPAARELMTGQTHVCGVIIPANGGVFFMDLVEELRRALKRRKLSLLLALAADEGEALEALGDFAARRVRGVALVPPSETFAVPREIAASCPMVSIVSPCAEEIVPCAAPNEVRTGYDGAAYLWQRGHRRIAYISSSRKARSIAERREGYLRFMREKGAEPCVLETADPAAVLGCVKAYMPTAFFCLNDWLALTALRALESAGIQVPGQISVLGVDNSPTFNALFDGMSTLSYPYAEVAEAAAAILAGRGVRLQKLPSLKVCARRTVADQI